MSFRILIADDHEIVRRGVRALLEKKTKWEVCGEAKDGVEAVQLAKGLQPDAVILDIAMPKLSGLQAARQIMDALPDTKVLVLTLYNSEETIRQVVACGARGFVLKSDAAQDLLVAMDSLRRNMIYFTPQATDMVLDGFVKPKNGGHNGAAMRTRLTGRERELIQLLAEGKSTKQAAGSLGMSVKTAETHRSNIMRKLQLHSVSELVLYAVRNKLVPLPADNNGAQS
jgi:DNA-binding NarL/FixJ family response regulator